MYSFIFVTRGLHIFVLNPPQLKIKPTEHPTKLRSSTSESSIPVPPDVPPSAGWEVRKGGGKGLRPGKRRELSSVLGGGLKGGKGWGGFGSFFL